MSSMVMWVVAHGSVRTKSSLMRSETGVFHCTSGYLSLSSTRNDSADAVNALVVEPPQKRVDGVTGVSGKRAIPYP